MKLQVLVARDRRSSGLTGNARSSVYSTMIYLLHLNRVDSSSNPKSSRQARDQVENEPVRDPLQLVMSVFSAS